MATGHACDMQITQSAQSCTGRSGFCCAGCVPSSARQIGTLPAGAPMASGDSEIVARRRIWHQIASSDAAKPIVGFSLWKETAFRSSTRRTGAHSICHIGTTSLAPGRKQDLRASFLRLGRKQQRIAPASASVRRVGCLGFRYVTSCGRRRHTRRADERLIITRKAWSSLVRHTAFRTVTTNSRGVKSSLTKMTYADEAVRPLPHPLSWAW